MESVSRCDKGHYRGRVLNESVLPEQIKYLYLILQETKEMFDPVMKICVQNHTLFTAQGTSSEVFLIISLDLNSWSSPSPLQQICVQTLRGVNSL